MRKIFVLMMAIMMMASSAFAEKITFVEYATYHLGSGDSEITAHEGARKECLKKAATAGGVYVQTYSKEQMFELTAHETEIVAANVIKAVEIEGESGMSKDRMNYDIAMECTLDTDDIYKFLQNRKGSNEVTPVKQEKKIIQHCIVIDCDEVTRHGHALSFHKWWIQTESGEEILKYDDFNGDAFTYLSYIRPYQKGYQPNDAYARFKSPTDFVVVKALKVTDLGFEDLAPIDQQDYLYRSHGALRGIIISDEDGEIMKQVFKNNRGHFPLSHLMITTNNELFKK